VVPSPRGGDTEPTPKTILLVEDEILIRLDVEYELSKAGFATLQASNADEALAVLHSSVHVDLVITDVVMPGAINGLQLALMVKATWPQLKVMILSGNVADIPVDLPVDAIMGKPCDGQAIVTVIEQLLTGHEQWRATT
jgi:two-component system, response regulator PdtaR